MENIVFVSSPYTHLRKEEEARRELKVRDYTGHLLRAKVQAFSPIVYGHVIATTCDLPTDWEFWQKFCLTYLSRSSAMHVFMLDGWDRSIGVAAEVYACKEMFHIPVYYVNADTYEILEVLPIEDPKL